ncbi:hypothetical protein HRbin35_00511 [bacterium HR35]|nr:hypothetical protein HRbin35_00511 [bacterium HR35]
MKVFADLHLHSKYSRGCSKNLDLENLVKFAKLKGLKLLITGDFTHPSWFKEIREKLEERDGIYKLKNSTEDIYFLIGGELSSIFSRKNKVYRIHYLLIFPNFSTAERFNKKLALYSNLASDGRPTLGLDVIEVLKIALDIYDKTIFIPAHIWTPWYSLYGSNSGFDSIYEAFNDFVNYVSAIETGLSSDPNLNWRLPELDNISIVSFSDAHSPYTYRIGREATLFELEKISFKNIYQALKNPDEKNKILMTIEFFPEEGKYHYDGHRNCKIRFSPQESKEHNYICPVCQKKVTIGVLSRIEKLAKRPPGYFDPQRPPFKRTVPLAEILSQIYSLDVNSKKIDEIYLKIIKNFGAELEILSGNFDKDKMKEMFPEVLLALEKIDKGDIILDPGYDGEYGKVIIKLDKELPQEKLENKKKSLF